MTIRRYIDAIQKDGFAVAKTQVLGEGMDSIAILVNDTTVFRFFKKQDNRALAAVENAILTYVRPFITLRIPQYTHIAASYEYVSYDYIEGDVFDKTLWDALSTTEQAHVSRQIGTFLSELHTCVTSKKAKDIGVPPMFGVYGHTTDTLMDALQAIRVDIPSELYQFFLSTIHDYEGYVSTEHVIPVMLHGDLNMTNLAYNKGSKEFDGIFDWSDIAVGDPHHDFWGLCDIDDTFVSQIIHVYTKRTGTGIHLEKVKNFAKIATIGWLMKQIQKEGFQSVDADIDRVYNWMQTT